MVGKQRAVLFTFVLIHLRKISDFVSKASLLEQVIFYACNAKIDAMPSFS
jgi:hypothetical protein